MEIARKILELKKEKNILLLAHFYQIPEIQDIADFVGDSLALAKQASKADVSMIAFAGVHFMAETAKILNPEIKVVLPDMEAGCSLADNCPPDKFKAFLNEYPDHKVITYINSSAAIKAMSDVICTSGNAVHIVGSFPKEEKIIFAPDKNLGGYINRITGRDMVLWDATCEVHDILSTEAIIKMKMEHPDAKLVAHPECKAPVLELADFIGSTMAMLQFTQKDDADKYIVATETGIIHQMRKNSPKKSFLIVPTNETCNCNDCPYMKMNTLEKLYLCMTNEKPQIELSEKIIEQAKKPILRMMDISRKMKLI